MSHSFSVHGSISLIELTFVAPFLLEKPAQLLIQQPVQSVIDFSLGAPAAADGTRRLNLLLSASHLDHKRCCSEHANQYPAILRSGFTAIAAHKERARLRPVLSY